MYQMLFKSRWIASLFVATIAYSAVAFVSDGSREDTLVQAAADLRGPAAKHDQLRHNETPHDQSRNSDNRVEFAFTPDSELIDDASGFDPSPMDAMEERSEGRDSGPDMDEYEDEAESDPEEHF